MSPAKGRCIMPTQGQSAGNVANNKSTSLISHYQSHNVKATCHICKVAFRRLVLLSTHLNNAHSPPICKKCHQSFSTVWELNKHAETPCVGSASFRQGSTPVVKHKRHNDNVSNKVTVHRKKISVRRDSAPKWRPKQRAERQPKKPEPSDNSVEYIVDEDDNDIDMESDCEKADDSTSSESDDEDNKRYKHTDLCPGDSESDGGSSSTDDSSDSSDSPTSKTTPAPLPSGKSSVCTVCGRGPFRSIKLHLLHCSGVSVKCQCLLCKKLFATKAALNEHLMPLYTCQICGQVFSRKNLYFGHQCPEGSISSLVLFCSESLPKACNICKSFFSSEKALLDHVTRVHTSVVSTKVHIITDPSLLTNKNVTGGVHRTEAQSAICSPNIANQTVNGKLCVGQAYAGSTVVKSSPSLSTSSMHIVSAAAPDKLSNSDEINKPTNQSSSHVPTPLLILPAATDTTPDTAAASDSVSPPSPTILAMFENDSQDVALMRRMNTGWRAKASHPCRQCGAILRQPSLIISHRYLHRGRRLHRCQCGRAFKHQLHLLRHCVQHAEAVSYICVSCGDTFTGAKHLAQHLKGDTLKNSCSGQKWKSKVKTKCRMAFTCDCGHIFFRPSAYIWHQLKNRTKSK